MPQIGYIDLVTPFQAGSNLVLHAAQVANQRELAKQRAAEFVQEMQASRALESLRKQQEERLKQQQDFQFKEFERERKMDETINEQFANRQKQTWLNYNPLDENFDPDVARLVDYGQAALAGGDQARAFQAFNAAGQIQRSKEVAQQTFDFKMQSLDAANERAANTLEESRRWHDLVASGKNNFNYGSAQLMVRTLTKTIADLKAQIPEERPSGLFAGKKSKSKYDTTKELIDKNQAELDYWLEKVRQNVVPGESVPSSAPSTATPKIAPFSTWDAKRGVFSPKK